MATIEPRVVGGRRSTGVRCDRALIGEGVFTASRMRLRLLGIGVGTGQFLADMEHHGGDATSMSGMAWGREDGGGSRSNDRRGGGVVQQGGTGAEGIQG